MVRTLLIAMLLAGCKGDDGETDVALPEDCEPFASAGADLAGNVGEAVQLDGSASVGCLDADLSYAWSFAARPEGSSADASSFGPTNGTPAGAQVSFVPDRVGTYAVALTVAHGLLVSNRDVVVVVVGADNTPPVADAGDDRVGTVGERAILDGSASEDPDGDALLYRWAFATVPAGSARDAGDLYDPLTAAASFVPDVAGNYVLSLEVGDGISWSPPDWVTVSVGLDNRPPVANAGTSRTLAPCGSGRLELDGLGSYDPDGDPLTWRWGLIEVPDGSAAGLSGFDEITAPDPTFAWDVVGPYTFWLQVHDGTIASPKDLVTITTVDAAANTPPVADAGADVVWPVEADCVSTQAGWICDDCASHDFEVDGTASTDANGDALTYRWSGAEELVFSSPNTGWTEVITPALPATYGVVTETTWTVGLDVADCLDVASDTVTVTVQCKGVDP